MFSGKTKTLISHIEKVPQDPKPTTVVEKNGMQTSDNLLLFELQNLDKNILNFLWNWSKSEPARICMFGKTGVGKSFLMNMISRMTMYSTYPEL